MHEQKPRYKVSIVYLTPTARGGTEVNFTLHSCISRFHGFRDYFHHPHHLKKR